MGTFVCSHKQRPPTTADKAMGTIRISNTLPQNRTILTSVATTQHHTKYDARIIAAMLLANCDDAHT